jgi:hypothetical protein
MVAKTRSRVPQREGRDSISKDPSDLEKNNAQNSEVEIGIENDKKEETDFEISSEEIKRAIALATEATTKTFGWTNNLKTMSKSNTLSEAIPGYIAPFGLDSSSLDHHKNAKRKLKTETIAVSNAPTTVISNKPTFASKNFKLAKADPANLSKSASNAGSGWFNFEATSNSQSLQADIAVIRNRNYLDPKKFYKSSDFSKKGSKMVQLGTVIEGSMESVFSNRLAKKQRKSNVMEEVMGEVFGSKDAYVKKKFTNMQREKSAAGQSQRKFQKGKGAFRKKGKR